MEKNSRFLISNGVLVKYIGDEESVTIPSGVNEIGESAFENNYTLKSVTICGGVEKIGDGAFAYCRSLREVKLPTTLREIGECAFSWCKNLGKIVIPLGVKKIRARAFEQLPSYNGEKRLIILCEAAKPLFGLPKGWSRAWTGYASKRDIQVVWDCIIY